MPTITKRQTTIIRGTIYEAKARYGTGARGKKAAVIAVMTMFVESGARVLANANVPESLKYPHDLLDWTYDGLGHDHASCGSYQQQTGCKWTTHGCGPAMNQSTMGSPNGWGTPKELMTPATAAGKFFKAMDRKHPGGSWYSRDGWVVAQNVQGSIYNGYAQAGNHYSSVYGGNYLGQQKRAKAAVALLWPSVSATKPAPKPAPPKKTASVKPAPKPKPKAKKKYVKVRSGQTLAGVAKNWHTTWQHLVQLNKKAYPSLVHRPDFIKVGWKLRVK